MRFLIDTCVLSEVQRPQGDQRVRTQMQALAQHELFLSAIAIGELTKGVALLNPSHRKQALSTWLATIERRYAARILPVDEEIARIWGELSARGQRQGVPLPVTDGLMAATALRHGLRVVTRNTRHFVLTGALIFDPWTESI